MQDEQLEKEAAALVSAAKGGEISREALRGAVRIMLRAIDPDPRRDGLRDTPRRVEQAWAHWAGGHEIDPSALLKTFEEQDYDGIVCQRDISFSSHCEHHLAPFTGTVTIAYLPVNGRVVGLSKLSRLVDCFARRLQIQERMTRQIADAIKDNLSPHCAVLVSASHTCISTRGIRVPGTITSTQALRGSFMDDGTLRAEFMTLVS